MASKSVNYAGSDQQKKSVYRNTVIFAVVAALITVLLLVLVIAVPAASQYRVAFLTVDLGLLAIIIYALVQINRRQARLDDILQNSGNNKMPVSACPDYFTSKYTSNGNVICVPEYKAPKQDVKFTFLDSDHRRLGNVELKDFDGHRAEDVCNYINADDYQGVEQKSVPWTELRAKCATLRRFL